MKMWRSDGNNPSISPILLSKFDPFDILQPQRTEAVNNGPQVDRLIDIEDFSLSAEVNASLMDQKADYDLVDLYQNMYVTPQHVKVKGKKEKAVTKNNDITNGIDYKDFFDKLESGIKFDWTNQDTVPNPDVITCEKPKVLVPKLSLDDDTDPEDFIDELLLKKSVEKRIFDELKASNKISASPKHNKDSSDVILEFPRLKVLNVPSDIDLEKPNTTVKANVSNTLIKDTASHSKNTNTDTDVTTGFSRFKLNNNIPHNIKIDGQINNSMNFKVIPIKKDEKLYKKKRVLKPESQTSTYTKGPDFDEKSVVLPQIMARIKARQAYLEEKNNQKKRFVLDTGAKTDTDNKLLKDQVKKSKDVGGRLVVDTVMPQSSVKNLKKSVGNDKNVPSQNTNDTFGKVSPIILMADCNKERLRAFRQGRMFQDFVLNGK